MATKCLNKQKLHIQRRIFSYIEIIERQLLKPTSKTQLLNDPSMRDTWWQDTERNRPAIFDLHKTYKQILRCPFFRHPSQFNR